MFEYDLPAGSYTVYANHNWQPNEVNDYTFNMYTPTPVKI